MKVGRRPGEEEVEAGEANTKASAGARSEEQAQSETARNSRVVLAPTSSTQRMLILDCWQRSGLKAQAFSELVGVSAASLYAWKRMFEEEGPAGLESRPRGVPRGSKLPETTQRAILMLKRAHPDWGHVASPFPVARSNPFTSTGQTAKLFCARFWIGLTRSLIRLMSKPVRAISSVK
jgi:hypothetical protein